MWAQATIIEVYTLAGLGDGICWRLILHWLSGASVYFLCGATFVYGLCLANHWPLTLLSTPALLVMMLPGMSRLRVQVSDPKTWVIGFLEPSDVDVVKVYRSVRGLVVER